MAITPIKIPYGRAAASAPILNWLTTQTLPVPVMGLVLQALMELRLRCGPFDELREKIILKYRVLDENGQPKLENGDPRMPFVQPAGLRKLYELDCQDVSLYCRPADVAGFAGITMQAPELFTLGWFIPFEEPKADVPPVALPVMTEDPVVAPIVEAVPVAEAAPAPETPAIPLA